MKAVTAVILKRSKDDKYPIIITGSKWNDCWIKAAEIGVYFNNGYSTQGYLTEEGQFFTMNEWYDKQIEKRMAE